MLWPERFVAGRSTKAGLAGARAFGLKIHCGHFGYQVLRERADYLRRTVGRRGPVDLPAARQPTWPKPFRPPSPSHPLALAAPDRPRVHCARGRSRRSPDDGVPVRGERPVSRDRPGGLPHLTLDLRGRPARRVGPAGDGRPDLPPVGVTERAHVVGPRSFHPQAAVGDGGQLRCCGRSGPAPTRFGRFLDDDRGALSWSRGRPGGRGGVPATRRRCR